MEAKSLNLQITDSNASVWVSYFISPKSTEKKNQQRQQQKNKQKQKKPCELRFLGDSANIRPILYDEEIKHSGIAGCQLV